ncbi:hypothetical protein C8Q80DRAFT_1272086 [Daedaleopsis nitida]|nr:hypothetical protein C8Q80DRAFT_1272086 [Daedaleopsis nitida]
MPSDAVYHIPPQLPPLPPQPSLASPSNWKLHYPPEEIQLPPSSWSTAMPQSTLKRSNSTSPPRRLPDPYEQVAGDSSTGSRARVVPFPTSSDPRKRTHSHSRSNSRVPIPVLPSASSSELVMVSPPLRTLSRSASVTLSKHPHPPLSTADPAAKEKQQDHMRFLPRVPKQPPPPLPLPDHVPVRNHSLQQPPLHSKPLMPVAASSPQLPTPTSPPVPFSAPPRPLTKYRNASSPTPGLPASPALRSAPVHRMEKERLRERTHTKSSGRRDERPVLVVLNPDEPFNNMHIPLPKSGPESAPVRPPIRAPTPPKPREREESRAHPTRQPSSWKHPESTTGRIIAAPVPERGRTMEVSMEIRTSAGRSAHVSGPESRRAQTQGSSSSSGAAQSLARKWVLEKNGKRLTQDSIVVAQQLRMLR